MCARASARLVSRKIRDMPGIPKASEQPASCRRLGVSFKLHLITTRDRAMNDPSLSGAYTIHMRTQTSKEMTEMGKHSALFLH